MGDTQRASLGDVKGELNDQIKTLTEISGSVSEGGKQMATLEDAAENCAALGVHQDSAFSDLKIAYEQLQEAVKKQSSSVQQEKLRKEGSSITPEQLSEYKEVFDHFDRDKDGKIDPLEFKGVLQALGDGLNETQAGALLTKLDKDEDGRLSFQEFLPYLEEKAKGSDSKSEIIASFKILAGDKEWITEEDMRKTLSTEKVEYLTKAMPKHSSGNGYDYKGWADIAFS